MTTAVGTAGLTTEHWRRWATGVSSLEGIARELGVRRQTVHAAMKSRGWLKTNYAMLHAVPAAAEPADTHEAEECDDDSTRQQNASTGQKIESTIEPVPERVSILSDDQRTAYYKAAGLATFQAGLMILTEAKSILERERGHHTPISLTRLAETVERAGKIMLPFLLEPPGANGGLTTLRIEVMSEADGDALQAELAAAYGETHEPAEPPPSAASTAPSASTTPAAAGAEHLQIMGPLPDKAGFADWLTSLAQQQGKRALRDIAEALGAEVGFGLSTEQLVATIIHRTGRDPDRLTSLIEQV